MKVLFVTHNYIRFKGDFSGVFLHLLAVKLRNFDIDVHVVAPHDAAYPEHEEIDGINIHRFRYSSEYKQNLAYRGNMHRQLIKNPFKIFTLNRFVKSACRLAGEVIEREKIEVVSIHWLIPGGMIGKRLLKKYGDKIRIHLSSHGTDVRLATRYPMVLSYFRPLIKKAVCWTVVSNFLKSKLVIKSPELENNIVCMPMPNDESVFYPDDSITKEKNLVVAVSRLTVQKRVNYLIEAVKLVAVKIPEIRLGIYGVGPEKFKLERQIEESGLTGRVMIKKPIPQEELRKVYNRASVMVLNSVDEGFGLSLTEAMLCRSAVIGTESGGITDIIEHDNTGLLVPADNVSALAEAIEKVLTGDTFRLSLAENGYNKAINNFSSQSAAKAFAELFAGNKNDLRVK